MTRDRIDAHRTPCHRPVVSIDLARLTPEQLLTLAEQATRLARDRLAVAHVGAVVTTWTLAPRRSILRDSTGAVVHLCSDGTWTAAGVERDGQPDAGPWTVEAVDVPDARHVTC